MTVPRFLTASAVAAGLAFGSAGVVMAASSLSSPGSDDFSQASPEASPSASASPDDSPSPSPSASFGDDVPAEVLAGLSEIPQSAAVTVAEAALGGDPGQIERAVLKIEDGRLIWDVRFSSDSRVEVDALTGDVVKVDARTAGTSGHSGGSVESGDDNGGARGAGEVESGDDHGGARGAGEVESGDDHGGNGGSGGSGAAGDDHGGSGNSGHGGSDD